MPIAEKLTDIQTKIKAPKNLYNKFGKYYYRNAESIYEAVKPYLEAKKCSLTIGDEIVEVVGRVYVKSTVVLVDNESGEKISISAYARESDDKKGMDDSQITGTASSYARKYALNGLFLLDDTKDADSDEHYIEEKAKQQQESVENACITDTKVKALRELLKKNGVSEKNLCSLYKVESIENLTEKKHANIVSHIDEIKEICSA